MKNYVQVFLKTNTRAAGAKDPFLPTLDELKREHIEYLLELTLQNKPETPRILNISRAASYYKLYAYQQLGSHDSYLCVDNPEPLSSN
jgi:DNA-binding NtrC family response regulator